MLSQLDRHDLAISRCGVPLRTELLNVCLSDPEPPRLEQALIWLSLLHGLDELGTVLATTPAPLALNQNQAVGLYAALHLAGNPAQAAPVLLRLIADAGAEASEAGTAQPWQVMHQLLERAKGSPWAELISQASLLHLSDPAALFAQWLRDLERSTAERMPFSTLLPLSILCRSPAQLPEDWQTRLAEAITDLGDLADTISLYRCWMVACQLAPDWDFACIRAADLALRFEDFAIADQLLERFEHTDIQNAWFYDVKARCRYGYGDLHAATRLWSLALAKVDAASPERHVFRDRMLVAVRGQFGLAEASRLARSGKFVEAVQLLQTLILSDPGFSNHYKLLHSLQEKLAGYDPQSTRHEFNPARVETVIEEFRSLWLTEEDSLPIGDAPAQVNADLKRAATRLDGIENSLGIPEPQFR